MLFLSSLKKSLVKWVKIFIIFCKIIGKIQHKIFVASGSIRFLNSFVFSQQLLISIKLLVFFKIKMSDSKMYRDGKIRID